MSTIDTERLLVYIALGESLERKGMTLDEIRRMAEATHLPVEVQPISDLNLNSRVYKSLIRDGLMTVDDLTQLTESQILTIRNLGPLGLSEIKSRLHDFGLHFRQAHTS